MKRIILLLIICVISPYFSISAQDFNPVEMVQMVSSSKKTDSYIIGQDCQTYTEKRWISPFEINRYETTYELWFMVKEWAEIIGYSFMNKGQPGSEGRYGSEPGADKDQPVTMISWYDAVIWCNAYSEQMGLDPCYTYNGEILRDSTNTSLIDLCQCDWDKNGYRLPSESEWEYAARKTKAGFQSGSSVSGQVNEKGIDDPSVQEEELCWTSMNTDRTHIVGTAGTPFQSYAPPEAGTGNPNGSGLYDMSGNILEFCWDWMDRYYSCPKNSRETGPLTGSKRVSRGGSWSEYTPFYYTGDRYSYDPNEAYNYFGFRIARTIK